MRILSNSTGSDSFSQASSQDRDFTAAFARQEAYQEIIEKAQSVSFVKIFKYYNIPLDSFNRKCVCPFSKHKGGRESTPSFYFYPDTNTFWCFGCKTGTTVVDFVANIEHCAKANAAFKILNIFNSPLDTLNIEKISTEIYQEKLELMFNFSNKIREMICSNPLNQNKIEELCLSFDRMNDKYDLDIDALKSLIDKINKRLDLII